MRLHDGRHTAATLLLSENVHPRVVMELLGHSQMRTTTDIYSHVMPALAREAADIMGAVLLTPSSIATTTATREIAATGQTEESPAHRGGAEGTRTPDPHTASVVRYQLRHSPISPPAGPATDSEREEARHADFLTAGGGTFQSRLQRPEDGVDGLLLQVRGLGDGGHQFLAVHRISLDRWGCA